MVSKILFFTRLLAASVRSSGAKNWTVCCATTNLLILDSRPPAKVRGLVPFFSGPLSGSAASPPWPRSAGSSGRTQSIHLAPYAPVALSAPPPLARRSLPRSIQIHRRPASSICPDEVLAYFPSATHHVF